MTISSDCKLIHKSKRITFHRINTGQFSLIVGYEKLRATSFIEFKMGMEVEGNLPSTMPHGNSEFVSHVKEFIFLIC